MADSDQQSVVIHYVEGMIQRGILQSWVPDANVIRYLPQHVSHGRRSLPRIRFITEVRIDHNFVRRATDLSAGGIYVETLTAYPVGAVLLVSFELGGATLDLTAKVAFNDLGIGMGLQFQEVSFAQRLQINTFVHGAMKGQEKPPSPDRRLKEGRPGESLGRPVSRANSDRRAKRMAPGNCIEVMVENLKLLFFLESEFKGGSSDQAALLSVHEATVEFSDGEKISGVLREISPTNAGFFFDAHVSERTSYTLFIVKKAVRSIEYL